MQLLTLKKDFIKTCKSLDFAGDKLLSCTLSWTLVLFICSFMAFGAGQRLCPGERFAKVRFFLYLSTLLQRWTFTFPKGESMSCDPRNSKSFDTTFIIRAKPFKCCAKPRSN